MLSFGFLTRNATNFYKPKATNESRFPARAIIPNFPQIISHVRSHPVKADPPMAIIRPSITFQPTIEEFFRQRSAAQLTVLSGPNNSGKSYLLKSLCNHTSESPLFFGCNRFFSLTQLSTNDMDPNYLSQLKINFTNHHYHPNEQQRMHNDETNFHNLEQILRGLTNSQRETLFGLLQDLIGNLEISEFYKLNKLLEWLLKNDRSIFQKRDPVHGDTLIPLC